MAAQRAKCPQRETRSALFHGRPGLDRIVGPRVVPFPSWYITEMKTPVLMRVEPFGRRNMCRCASVSGKPAKAHVRTSTGVEKNRNGPHLLGMQRRPPFFYPQFRRKYNLYSPPIDLCLPRGRPPALDFLLTWGLNGFRFAAFFPGVFGSDLVFVDARLVRPLRAADFGPLPVRSPVGGPSADPPLTGLGGERHGSPVRM